MNPRTLEEWQQYIRSLDAEELFNVAYAAGTMKFAEKLRGEGYAAKEITTILTRIAFRLLELEVAPPREGACVVDYRWLASGKPIASESDLAAD